MTSGTAPIDAPRRARVAIPFLACTLIWSSTWLVIRTQLGDVPPGWSITYRFGLAALAMFGFVATTGARLRLSGREQGFALFYGVSQYCLNYLAVYRAEQSVTSGLVAVLFAGLLVPNTLLGWAFLRQGVSRAFLAGSIVAMAGMALLFAHELDAAAAGRVALMVGIGWSIAGVLFSSIANVAQGVRLARSIPIASLVAWGMAWGTIADAAAAWAVDGPPVIDPAPAYWAGTLYLALIGSALAFTFYFHVVREIGPGRAAYTSVLSPPVAMLLSTLFEGYRWSWGAALGGMLALAGLIVALRAKAASPAR